jgi:hypothetical protein
MTASLLNFKETLDNIVFLYYIYNGNAINGRRDVKPWKRRFVWYRLRRNLSF